MPAPQRPLHRTLRSRATISFPGGGLHVSEGLEAQRNVIYDLVDVVSWSSMISVKLDRRASEQTGQAVTALGRRFMSLTIDLRQASVTDVYPVVTQIATEMGRLDVLVNNAGINVCAGERVGQAWHQRQCDRAGFFCVQIARTHPSIQFGL
jgi:hypothetical protein